MAQRNPLPRICIAMGFPDVEKLLEHARREVEAGESFFEFRLDYLADPERGVQAIRRFLTAHPECTILATCRRHQNQGKFNGSIEEQVRVLDAAIDGGAKAVDLEIESAENVVAKVDQLRGRAQLVLSYHNFEGTPVLDNVVRRMVRIPADAYKIVTTAKKPSDNYRVLSLAKANPRMPLVMLAQGETGFATRVLSPAWGGLYTYAAPSTSEGTSVGQVSARMLRHMYRVEKFSKAAKLYGVIADPVRHSISPAVHNRAFQARRLDAVYLPFLVHAPQLKDFFTLCDNLPLAGISVTIPHKQKVLRYLDIIDPLARRIGAVNTIWKKGGKWRGANTDAEAVTIPLAKHMRLSKANILLAGNGGAARSAAFALLESGAKVSIVGRNPDRVRAFAKMCGGEPLLREQAESRHFDAFLHATPLGMYPRIGECFFPDCIPADVVFDMVYNPMDTVLLKRAAEQGKVIIRGLEMFIEQAVKQFEIWTGEQAPRSAMEKAAMEALGASRAEAAGLDQL
ncbi:MAG TPA: shikimate dehydrogenase [Bryobacteraceae bacterium]|nr:shikimate dehydrogenase [Bryobacteraceae bacterium]